MLDLILAYFKTIYRFFDELEEAVSLECESQQARSDIDIYNVVKGKVVESGDGNLMMKVFSLKNMGECEMEADI